MREQEDGEHLDFAASRAFAMVDHQLAHIYVNDGGEETAEQAAKLFQGRQGIAEVLVGAQRSRYALDHPRSGDVILISTPDSWQAYYWWLSDDRAPRFARTVDIHRKPGYDPVELFFDPATKSIPLNASLVKGSHGAPAVDRSRRSVILASEPIMFPGPPVADTDVFGIVMKHFGISIK